MKQYILSEKFFDKIFDLISEFGIKMFWTLVILSVGFKLSKYLVKWTKKIFERSTIDDSVATFLLSVVRIGSKIFVIIIAIANLGINTSSFVTVIASAGVAIGLALQGSLSNVCGGLLILLIRPFQVGDMIKEDAHGNEGTVVAIDLFYTRIQTVDNKVVVIPNSVITNNSLTNITRQNERRLDMRFGIGYDDDIQLAKSIVKQIAESHAVNVEGVEPVQVYVDELGDSSIYIGLRVWVPTDQYQPCRWDILERVKSEFDVNGIHIPYNQMDVHVIQETQTLQS